MASPNQTHPPVSVTQTLTPPAEPSSSSQLNANDNTTATTTTANTTNAPPVSQPPQIPATSLKDTGKSRRPRDVRLIHLLLASLGVTAYQERVPLQLLDFAYRYTSSVLQDAVHLSTEGYAGAIGTDAAPTSATGAGGGGGGGRGPQEVNTVTLPALRLSIASRLHYQFQTGLPKEFLMDVAAERNRIALPGATRGFDSGAANAAAAARANQSVVMAGMRLPPERFCLTGLAWNLKDEWESEGEEEVGVKMEGDVAAQGTQSTTTTTIKGAADADAEDGMDEDGGDDEDGKMEDIFGDDTVMGEGGEDEDGDRDMTGV